jgi:[ribosomal protein S5]-alanine N-acetyltransferase
LIETERLRLRLPELEDVPAVLLYYTANREHLEPWSPVPPPGFYTEDYWRDQVAHRQKEYAQGLGARLFVHRKDDPGRVIGNLSLTQVQRGALQSCYLGYSLDAAEQGHGYMLEAVRGAVGFAFAELGLHRVVANYMPHNHRSGSVLRRAGFQVEGYSNAYLLINGRWEDHVNAAIVNPGR